MSTKSLISLRFAKNIFQTISRGIDTSLILIKRHALSSTSSSDLPEVIEFLEITAINLKTKILYHIDNLINNSPILLRLDLDINICVGGSSSLKTFELTGRYGIDPFINYEGLAECHKSPPR
ncbi:hypothetical protein RF11_05112 [Thelohanellus kitauei]|uniref:Uncharacterized protein n=1 Tax=Thelohanellus kitauei TaxID=669202 RepID=A0A0C2MQC5_THEKT|nr:hypothetical protein RF11_05112 [Thelohanellus kitauei]